MQATLLGVSIAIIVALLTALIGPYFVNWSAYRSVFEAHASRLIGAPVRVEGRIDVRLLPTPSLVMRQVEAGAADEAPRLKARELSVELALGPTLRGKWQVAEAHLIGLEVQVGFDSAGHVDWPVAPEGFDPEQVSIGRLTIEDGRAVISSAAGSRITVEDLRFDGEVRSLAGPIKGAGSFAFGQSPYRFDLASGRLDENDTAKLHVSIDPVEWPLTIETEGTLDFSGDLPEFLGTLNLARPAGVVDASGRGVVMVPWRATGQIKANPASTLIQQGEFQYGPDEQALKLSATANVTFGKTPRFDAVVSGGRLNLDGVMDLPEPARRLPVLALGSLVEHVIAPFKLAMPGKVGIAIDAVTLAGSSIEEVRGDLSSNITGWDLQTIEFRAPGMTRVRASGRLGSPSGGVTFKGAATVEAVNPRAMVAWLEAQDSALAPLNSFGASGDVTLTPDHIAIDHLKAEFDRRTVEGRLDYTVAADQRPARLMADLKAATLDIDQLEALAAAALASTNSDLPAELALTADVGEATLAGVDAKNAHVKLVLDANGLMLDRLSIADLGGAALEASGRMSAPWSAPRGTLSLDLDARTLESTLALLAKFAPNVADIVRPVTTRVTPIKAHAVLAVSGADASAEATTSKFELSGAAGPVRLGLNASAAGNPWNAAALGVTLNGQLAADDGTELGALLGLYRFASIEKTPATLTLAAQGPIGGELETHAWLSAGGLSTQVSGIARLLGEEARSARLELAATAADIGPSLRSAGLPAPPKLPLTLSSHVTVDAAGAQFEDLTATLAGRSLQGRLGITLDPVPNVNGRLNADDLDVFMLVGLAIGFPQQVPGLGSVEPFAPGLFGKISTHVEFDADRAILTPTLRAREAHGVLRIADREVALERFTGNLAGGRLNGDFTFQKMPDGLNAKGRLALENAEASPFLPASDRPAISGRLSLTADIQGAGRSPITLVGSLSGLGTLALEQAQFVRLNPRTFDDTVRAVDQGLAIEPKKVGEFVGSALEAGALNIPRLNAPLTIASGQARLINVVAHGEGADVGITGHLDLSDWTVEAQLTLTGPTTGTTPRPDIFVALHGPVTDVRRTPDVSAFANWLLLRSLDREASRVEAPEPPTGTTIAPGVPPNGPSSPKEPSSTGAGEPLVHQGETPVLPLPSAEGRSLSSGEEGVRARAHPRRAGSALRLEGAPYRVLRPPSHHSIFDQLFGTERRGGRFRRIAPCIDVGVLSTGPRPVVLKHEQTNRRREIAVVPATVDRCHQIGQGHIPGTRNLLEPLPKRIFQTDARLVSGDDDRSFNDRRLHSRSPGSIRAASSVRRAFSARAVSSARSLFVRPKAKRFSAARCAAWRRAVRLRTIRRLTRSPMVSLNARLDKEARLWPDSLSAPNRRIGRAMFKKTTSGWRTLPPERKTRLLERSLPCSARALR